MGAVKRWFDAWRDLLALAFVIVMFALVWHQGQDIKGISRSNTRVTMLQCKRTREFSPPLADFYEHHHALSAKQLHDYRATIPKHC